MVSWRGEQDPEGLREAQAPGRVGLRQGGPLVPWRAPWKGQGVCSGLAGEARPTGTRGTSGPAKLGVRGL